MFGDNCAACHGLDAKGGPGFPNLTTASWLWGGEPEIFETIRVGINSAHQRHTWGRCSPSGVTRMLQPADVHNVVNYVQSLSDPVAARQITSGDRGGQGNLCRHLLACHGDDGKGKRDVGAPDLTDRHSIYGSDAQSILTSVWSGRQGHMPSWEGRLNATDRKSHSISSI